MYREVTIALLLGSTAQAKTNPCKEIHDAMVLTIQAGASMLVISKGADDLYPIISDLRIKNPEMAWCATTTYAFRTLRKPYNGEAISPKDWDEAMRMLTLSVPRY